MWIWNYRPKFPSFKIPEYSIIFIALMYSIVIGYIIKKVYNLIFINYDTITWTLDDNKQLNINNEYKVIQIQILIILYVK